MAEPVGLRPFDQRCSATNPQFPPLNYPWRMELELQITDKALRQLNAIEKILLAAVQERKGGNKTAERGPEYSRKIAAMRETRADGGRKKQVASA